MMCWKALLGAFPACFYRNVANYNPRLKIGGKKNKNNFQSEIFTNNYKETANNTSDEL